MSNPSRLLAVVALLAFSAAGAAYLSRPVVAQEKAPPAAPVAATKWEYRLVLNHGGGDKGAEEELNKLGAEGFEIAFQTSSHASNGGGAGTVPVVTYTLKRVKK